MIFSSSGSRTWGTHSFRTAAHRLPGSLDWYLHELWGLSEVTTNWTNLWYFGADWHLCSKPRSPSVSGHLPPEQPCLQRVRKDFKMANTAVSYQHSGNCVRVLFSDNRASSCRILINVSQVLQREDLSVCEMRGFRGFRCRLLISQMIELLH